MRDEGSGFRAQGLGFRVRIQAVRLRVSYVGLGSNYSWGATIVPDKTYSLNSLRGAYI